VGGGGPEGWVWGGEWGGDGRGGRMVPADKGSLYDAR